MGIYISNFQVRMDTFCIAEGTGVELVQGMSVPIESVKVGDYVHGLADDSRGLVGRAVTAVMSRGPRECVELLFSDGRTLTCTPDHRILTADGQWVEAGRLIVGQTEVSVGPTYPLQRARDVRSSDDEWKIVRASARPRFKPGRCMGIKEAVQQAHVDLQTTRALLPATLRWLPHAMVQFDTAPETIINPARSLIDFGFEHFLFEKPTKAYKATKPASPTALRGRSILSHRRSSSSSTSVIDLTSDGEQEEDEEEDEGEEEEEEEEEEVMEEEGDDDVEMVDRPPPPAADGSGNRVRYGVPRSATALPTFKVKLVGRRPVGIKNTFDLTVPAPAGVEPAFTAGGIVVHNWCLKQSHHRTHLTAS